MFGRFISRASAAATSVLESVGLIEPEERLEPEERPAPAEYSYTTKKAVRVPVQPLLVDCSLRLDGGRQSLSALDATLTEEDGDLAHEHLVMEAPPQDSKKS